MSDSAAPPPCLTPVIETLRAEGLLDEDGRSRALAWLVNEEQHTPWYVHVLLGVAAWFAMLLLLLALALARVVRDETGAMLAGVVFLVGATVARRASVQPFAVQAALATVLTGGVLLTGGASVAFDGGAGGAVLALTSLIMLFAYPDTVVRFLAVPLATLGVALVLFEADTRLLMHALVIGNTALAAWLWLAPAQRLGGWLASHRGSIAGGAVAAMAGLLLPSSLAGMHVRELVVPAAWISTVGVGVVLMLAIVTIWQRLAAQGSQARLLTGLALVGLLMIATLPAPGIAGAVLVLLIGQYRDSRILIGAGVLLALAFLSAYYYHLGASLLVKSLTLMAAGAVLLLGRSALRHVLPDAGADRAAADPRRTAPGWREALLGLGLLASLALPGAAIVGKEMLLRDGTTMLLQLAPRDPRSLMQGDFMRLRYSLARQMASEARSLQVHDGALVVRLDPDGVARDPRPYTPGTALASGEHLLRWRVRAGRPRIGTDAFFFQEGMAERYAQAAYGEYRVASDGEAVLVGLVDAQFEALPSAPTRQ